MIRPTRYQPILWQLDGDTSCDSLAGGECGTGCGSEAGNWNQKMFANDVIGFQFVVTPCQTATNLVTNPDFSGGDTGWTLVNSASINPFSGAFLLEGGDEIIQESFLTVNTYYYVSITSRRLSGESAGQPISLSLTGIMEDVEFFSTTATTTQSFYVRSSAGNIGVVRNTISTGDSDFLLITFVSVVPVELPSIFITDLAGATLDTFDEATFQPPYLNTYYAPIEAVINNGVFQIKVVYACTGEAEVIYFSEPIEIIAADPCFIQIGGCGNINVLEGGFTPFMRLESKLIADRSPNYERFLTRRTSGRYRMNYGRSAKTFTLSTVHVPEHVRDFLYILPLCDKIVIKKGEGSQVAYFVDEEPDAPDFLASSDNLASIQLPLVYKEDLIESIYVQECNVFLPPRALGYRQDNLIIKAAVNTGIKA